MSHAHSHTAPPTPPHTQALELLSYPWKPLDTRLEGMNSVFLTQLGYPYRFISHVVQYVLTNLIRVLVVSSSLGERVDTRLSKYDISPNWTRNAKLQLIVITLYNDDSVCGSSSSTHTNQQQVLYACVANDNYQSKLHAPLGVDPIINLIDSMKSNVQVHKAALYENTCCSLMLLPQTRMLE